MTQLTDGLPDIHGLRYTHYPHRSDGPRMCFNGHKHWILGWYDESKVTVNPIDDGPWLGILTAPVDYETGLATSGTAEETVVLVRVDDLYIQFNRAVGFNADVIEKRNQLTITEAAFSTSMSESVAGLDMNNQRYTAVEELSGSGVVTVELCNFTSDNRAVVAIYTSLQLSPCPNSIMTDVP